MYPIEIINVAFLVMLFRVYGVVITSEGRFTHDNDRGIVTRDPLWIAMVPRLLIYLTGGDVL